MKKRRAQRSLAWQQASTNRHVSAYHVAVIHVALGDTNAGLDWLERAYDEQSPWIGYLRVDPRVDPRALAPAIRKPSQEVATAFLTARPGHWALVPIQPSA